MEPLRAGDPREVGRYLLAARLGSGGMGRVYLGFSPAGRAVAVKVIRPELARDQGFVRRFRREVAAARLVSGLYTATVVDAGEEPPWLATAFVPGPPLADMVEAQGPLPEDPVWRLAGGLVEALAAVHACGLVHRDLKPANVLLAADGPRLIDFGISLALEGTALTGTGLAIGTPGFMSPEQADGERAGPASDVFSLGSVLTYTATGAGPFGAGQAAAVIYRIVHSQPALGGVPGPLRGLIADCLATDPAHRPTLDALMGIITARRPPGPAGSAVSFWPPALAEFIGSYQAGLAVQLPAAVTEEEDAGPSPPAREPTQAAATHDPQRPPAAAGQIATGEKPSPPSAMPPSAGSRPARRWARRTFLAAGVLGAAGATAAVLASQIVPHHAGPGDTRTRHHHTTRAVSITARLTRTLTDPGTRGFTTATHVTAIAFSPDGRTLAACYEADLVIPGYTYLWATATGRSAGTFEDAVSSGVLSVAFSPDGRFLATGDYGAFTDLWDTTTRHRMARLAEPEFSGVTAVAFSPDSRTLATGDYHGGSYLWDTATRRRAATLTGPGSSGVTAVAFSPDGRTLAVGGSDGVTGLWDTATRRRAATLTGPGSSGVTAVAFSPDGRTLAVGDGNGKTYLWDTATGRALTLTGAPPVSGVAFSPDGRTLAVGDSNGQVVLWDAATRRRAAVLTEPGSPAVTAVAFSPDGKTLAVGDYSRSSRLWGIRG
jgi:hypothetical protein